MKKTKFLSILMILILSFSNIALGSGVGSTATKLKPAAYYWGGQEARWNTDYFDGESTKMEWLSRDTYNSEKNKFGWLNPEPTALVIQDEMWSTENNKNTFIANVANGEYTFIYVGSEYTADYARNNVDITIEDKTYNVNNDDATYDYVGASARGKEIKVPVIVSNNKFIFDIKEKNGSGFSIAYFALVRPDGYVEGQDKPTEKISDEIYTKDNPKPKEVIPGIPEVEYGKATGVRIILNRKLLDLKGSEPFIDSNNRVLMPLRVVSEELGADVKWDAATKQITMTKGETVVKITIGSDSFFVGQWEQAMVTPAVIKNGVTYVPVRITSTLQQGNTTWDSGTKTVTLTSYSIQ